MATIPSYLLSLAGEYRVCSELIKRGVFVTMTYGNRKEVDVYAISDRQKRAVKIEVKTIQQDRFVTNITRTGLDKARDAPDFWVLFQTQHREDDTFNERFFILTHQEICKAQRDRNEPNEANYFAKHGKPRDPSKSVDTLSTEHVKQYENKWSTIVEGIGRSAKS